MIALMLRGYCQVFPVAVQTALIAHGHLWLVAPVGYFISWIWRRNARGAALEIPGWSDHFYALGAALGSVTGLLFVHFIEGKAW